MTMKAIFPLYHRHREFIFSQVQLKVNQTNLVEDIEILKARVTPCALGAIILQHSAIRMRHRFGRHAGLLELPLNSHQQTVLLKASFFLPSRASAANDQASDSRVEGARAVD